MVHYILTSKELLSLLKDSEKLSVLVDAGVDNWEGYDEAFRELEADHNHGKPEDHEYEDCDEIIDSMAESSLSKYKTTTINE